MTSWMSITSNFNFIAFFIYNTFFDVYISLTKSDYFNLILENESKISDFLGDTSSEGES